MNVFGNVFVTNCMNYTKNASIKFNLSSSEFIYLVFTEC